MMYTSDFIWSGKVHFPIEAVDFYTEVPASILFAYQKKKSIN